jgi:transposase InsO family protein
MDFIGEISPKSSTGYSWILVATNYFTKWVEAIPTRNATSKVVNNFLLNNIISRFGCPQKIVTENSMCFRSNEFIKFCDKYGITRSSSSPYHPQGNGKVESTNKSLLKVIKRTLDDNKKHGTPSYSWQFGLTG